MSDAAAAAGAVRLSLEGAVATVVFDRPAARNAMTWGMYQQLEQICQRLAAATDVRVAVFRGAGGEAFVAGTDIAQFSAFRSGQDGVGYEHRIDAVIGALGALPMPTVAVIEGWAIGGGLAIATACDFRLATPTARFGVPIARTLGNCLSVANLARLEAAFGLQHTRRMLLLAQVLDAEQALACGFLERICDAGELDAAVAQLCAQLAALAPVTQRITKTGLARVVAQRIADGDDLVRRCYGSADFQEGVAAFVARRQPVWRGQ
ncbi:enoyl-CoA hydratase/isomerase family protein [Ottowia sp.]|uniref:enoyl-CoA hydratase/isomerase family protein n=1 Tax=Ottowia sp. TaxID=1898956 RepID=UPI002C6AC970|nr:enoyl-CoA hydratase/isomerase family protein [Ottowia sp.]HRN74328.1 enoyl-CoA hydratase/isomerase family protein [Ottowia sp.]HRQ01312.1 enoyl-CoA hydratase/isomerase family protein [Ottowia sp.]